MPSTRTQGHREEPGRLAATGATRTGIVAGAGILLLAAVPPW
ncbi:hypothetical protein [Plantactinospora sp. DSM 117369]